MSHTPYYIAWLAVGLAIIAIASAAIIAHLRLRALRRDMAGQLLDSLANYSDWIAGQGGAAFFQGDAQSVDSPLQDMRNIQREWFPELYEETTQLLEVHARLIDFLWAQQLLRDKDAEAWFESDHDLRFMQLWRAHRGAAQAIAEKLKGVSDVVQRQVEKANQTHPA